MTASDELTPEQMLARLNRATYEALKQMRQGNSPKLAHVAELYYPNGCPILGDGPQRDDL